MFFLRKFSRQCRISSLFFDEKTPAGPKRRTTGAAKTVGRRRGESRFPSAMGGSLRRQKRRDASAPRKKTLCSASVSFFDAVFRSVERFKSNGTGSAAPLRTGRAAATAASAGQGTTKPSEQIDARECEQDNDYGRLHDVSPQTECASVYASGQRPVFFYKGLFRHLMPSPAGRKASKKHYQK